MKSLFRHHLRQTIAQTMETSPPFEPEVTIPGRHPGIDLATNAALMLAPGTGLESMSIAARLVESLKIDPMLVGTVAIVPPGYINIRFSAAYYSQALHALEARGVPLEIPDICCPGPIRDTLQRVVGILRHARSLDLLPTAPESPIVTIEVPEEVEVVRATLHLDDATNDAMTGDEGCRHAARRLTSAIDDFYYRVRVVASAEPDRTRRLRILCAAAGALHRWITTRHTPSLESGS